MDEGRLEVFVAVQVAAQLLWGVCAALLLLSAARAHTARSGSQSNRTESAEDAGARSTAARVLARASYSTYAFGTVAAMALHQLLFGAAAVAPRQVLMAAPLSVGLSFALGILVHVLVEVPGGRVMRAALAWAWRPAPARTTQPTQLRKPMLL
jgi:hypothetical protein